MYLKYNFKGVTMFCVQCEQTIRTPAGNGCSYAQGMCGKTAETSDLQDLLIAALQGLSAWALKARNYDVIDHEIDSFAPSRVRFLRSSLRHRTPWHLLQRS